LVHYDDYADKKPFIDECEPSFAYMKLIQDDFCYLIDVRSKPEWSFVGIPDSKDMKNEVIFCECAFYPLMDRNLHFENEIFSKLKMIGFSEVEINPNGYVSGSLNVILEN
jgi:hypothetical protein